MWTVRYDNAVGRNDEGFWEWWGLEYDGDRIAKFDEKEDAEAICAILNLLRSKPGSYYRNSATKGR